VKQGSRQGASVRSTTQATSAPHDEGGHSRPEGEHQGIPEQPQDVPARIGLDEIVEGEKRAGTKSGVLGERVCRAARESGTKTSQTATTTQATSRMLGRVARTKPARPDRGAGGAAPPRDCFATVTQRPLSIAPFTGTRHPEVASVASPEGRRPKMSGPLIRRGSPPEGEHLRDDGSSRALHRSPPLEQLVELSLPTCALHRGSSGP